ncbi:MAG: T9SS type A sorting domain-containing protein [Imperialibacter sp.]|uniref:T9SS type A sorting domain-containing protein n=1 Tax=Imperialibacter sp. TaxID=2038411 RepID=UPI0032EBE1DC
MKLACYIKKCLLAVALALPFASAAQNPGGVSSGLNLWLKANTEVYFDGGTTLATNGQTATQWNDQSPSSNNVSQSTLGNRPIYRTLAANFNPVLTFSKNQFLDVTSALGIGSTSDYTYFIVFEPNSITTGGATDGSGDYIIDRTSGTNDLTSLKFTAGPNLFYQTRYNNGSGLGGPAKSVSAGNRYIAEYHRDYNVEFGISLNGGTKTTIASNANALTPPAMRLGRHATTTNGGLDGDIAEVIIYSQYPSATDFSKINSYLAIKYGIALNQTTPQNYIASNGTTIFDAVSAYSAYSSGIAGIGRDDASGLSQTRSINSNDQMMADKGGSFSSDFDFLVWGNDGGPTTTTLTNIHPSYSYRIERIWRTDITGTPGAVSVRFLLTGGIGNSGDETDYALLIKNSDTDFSTGVTPHTAGAVISGDTLTFTGVTFGEGDYFTLATNLVTPNPGGPIGALKLWLSVTNNTNCITDGCTITSWGDKSLNNYSVSVVNNPIYSADQINFNPAIETSNDYFNISGVNLDFTQGFEMFWVGRFDDGDGAIFAWNVGTDNHALLMDHLGPYGTLLGAGGSWIGLADPTAYFGEKLADNDPVIGRIDHLGNGSAVNIHSNGGSALLSGNATYTNSGANNFRIAARSNGTQYYNGLISEVLVYNSTMTEEEKAQIESMLAVKYGITRTGVDDGATALVDERDYIANDGAVIWDYSSNSAYHNNVAGIGRDYPAGLNQTKSKSESAGSVLTMDNGGGFSANYDYLVWGNDNAALESTGSTDLPSGIVSRLERVWLAQKTGTIGTVNLEFDMSSVEGPAGPGTNDLSYTALLVDDDGDFTNASIVYPFSYDNTAQTVSFNNDFSAGTEVYFTVGSTDLSAAPLPIELLSFVVKEENGQVRIDWETASETNNDFFSLERSKDGVDFEKIKRVDGAGNSGKVLKYLHYDTNPLPGTSFYRLKQTDFDGTFTYSMIRKATFQNELQAITIFPNPAQNEVHVRGLKSIDETSAKVFRLSGKQLAIPWSIQGDDLVADVRKLPAGIFVLHITSPEDNGVFKLIKK